MLGQWTPIRDAAFRRLEGAPIPIASDGVTVLASVPDDRKH